MADSKNTYSTVTPYLIIPDADAELSFLKAAFGAVEIGCQRNADKAVMHAEVRIGDSLVMLAPRSRAGPIGRTLGCCASTTVIHAAARAAIVKTVSRYFAIAN